MVKPIATGGERPPPSNRTLPLGSLDPREVPAESSSSAKRARALIAELEEIAAAEETSASQSARLERAWNAWNLDGANDETIARVAHLVDRAYSALHQAPARKPSRKSSGLAVSSCAQVLHSGLPPSVRDRLDFSDVMAVVHELERAVEQWPAVVRATAELLGWSKVAMSHASHAVKQALATKLEPLG